MDEEQLMQAFEDGDYLYHHERDNYYELLDLIPVKLDTGWLSMMLYQDVNTKIKYVRAIDNFTKFIIA